MHMYAAIRNQGFRRNFRNLPTLKIRYTESWLTALAKVANGCNLDVAVAEWWMGDRFAHTPHSSHYPFLVPPEFGASNQ